MLLNYPFYRKQSLPPAPATERRGAGTDSRPAGLVRVLHVFKSSYHHSRGGIENALRQMVHSSSALGVQNTILCIGNEPASCVSSNGSARVVACPPSLAYDSLCFSTSMFARFRALVREHDLVHYHFPFPQQDIMHLWLNPSVPSVLTYHSDIVRQRFLYGLYRPLLTRFLSRVDAIVATSENYLASSRILRQYRKRVSVIPLGLDQDFYPTADPALQRAWETRVGRDFFFFVGVLRYYKGLDILLQAASRTRQRFVIAGIGPMQTYLREKAAALGLQNVTFLGSITEADKAALFHLCRALVFPSHLRSEAFGLTLVEGAMFGKPLISCDIGTGTSFINHHEVTGLVVRRGDPSALLEAVETLAENPGMAGRFGENARKRYLELFTASVQAAKYDALYRRLLGVPRETDGRNGK